MSKSSRHIRKLILAALFVALDIVLTRFFSFYLTQTSRIGFQAVAYVLGGYYLGPIYAAGAFAAGDILGVLINSGGFAIHPGFTLGAALSGALLGVILHRKPVSLLRTFLAVGLHTVLLNLLLRSVWLMQMYGSPYFAVVTMRAPVVLLNGALVFIVSALLLKALPKQLLHFASGPQDP